MKKLLLPLVLLSLLAPAPSAAGFRVNALQDCWTIGGTTGNITNESYQFRTSLETSFSFAWVHKIQETCSNYAARIVGFECAEGATAPSDLLFDIRVPVGQIDPDPIFSTITFAKSVQLSELPAEGEFDWMLIVECDDSGNGVLLQPDGDPDQICGGSFGAPPASQGPVVFGPQPQNFLDIDPGGFPPGLRAGEDTSTRPWCFRIVE